MGRQRPASVDNAVRVQAALVVVAAVATGLVAVMNDELVGLWAQTHGGLEAVETSQIQPPAFVPVAVVTFIVYALLVWVLGVLFGKGHGWARFALAATAVCNLFSLVVIYLAEPPGLLVAVGALAAVLNLVLLWLLASRDTGEFVAGAHLAEQREHSS